MSEIRYGNARQINVAKLHRIAVIRGFRNLIGFVDEHTHPLLACPVSVDRAAAFPGALNLDAIFPSAN